MDPLRRAKRVAPSKVIRYAVGTARDVEILLLLAWGGYLTTSQITRVLFPSSRTAQRRLRALVDAELIRAHLQGGAFHLDNIYTLAPAGVARLHTLGHEIGRPGRVPRLQKLAHGRAIRDVFVAFCLAEKRGYCRIQDFRFDADLTKEPIFKAAGIIPDALVALVHQERRFVVGCEVDLGTESTRTLRTKFDVWGRLLRNRILPGGLLVAIAPTRARARSMESLANEVDCPLTLLDFDELVSEPLVAIGRVFARSVRSERTGITQEPAQIRLHDDHEAVAFRVLT